MKSLKFDKFLTLRNPKGISKKGQAADISLFMLMIGTFLLIGVGFFIIEVDSKGVETSITDSFGELRNEYFLNNFLRTEVDGLTISELVLLYYSDDDYKDRLEKESGKIIESYIKDSGWRINVGDKQIKKGDGDGKIIDSEIELPSMEGIVLFRIRIYEK